MRFIHRLLSTVAFAMVTLNSFATQPDNGVVRIKSGNSFQSGFITTIISNESRVSGVVTALHGILMGNGKPYIVHDTQAYPLVLAYVDIKRDVAFMKIDHSIELRPLTCKTSIPVGKVYVAGYPFGMAQLRTREAKIGNPATQTLEDFQILDKSKWQERNSPTLKTRIMNIDGDATHGDSGAPVLNQDNQVVGVINGGFDSGRIGMAWAIPWGDIIFTPLEQAQNEVDRLRQRSLIDKALFSTPPGRLQATLSDLMPCGPKDKKCWNIWFSQMERTIVVEGISNECDKLLDKNERGECEFALNRDLKSKITACKSATALLRSLNDPDYCIDNKLFFTGSCREAQNKLAQNANRALRLCNSQLFEPEWVRLLLNDAVVQ